MNKISNSELKLTFSCSSGAGGQNVNKTFTKVFVHWNVGKSRVFSEEEKFRIRMKLKNRLNNYDEVVVDSEEERSQTQNRDLAVSRLQSLVVEALKVPKKRRATRPTKSSKLKRLESKKKRGEVKKLRRNNFIM